MGWYNNVEYWGGFEGLPGDKLAFFLLVVQHSGRGQFREGVPGVGPPVEASHCCQTVVA